MYYLEFISLNQDSLSSEFIAETKQCTLVRYNLKSNSNGPHCAGQAN